MAIFEKERKKWELISNRGKFCPGCSFRPVCTTLKQKVQCGHQLFFSSIFQVSQAVDAKWRKMAGIVSHYIAIASSSPFLSTWPLNILKQVTKCADVELFPEKKNRLISAQCEFLVNSALDMAPTMADLCRFHT